MAHRAAGFINPTVDRSGCCEQSTLLDGLSGSAGKNAARTAPSASRAIPEHAPARRLARRIVVSLGPSGGPSPNAIRLRQQAIHHERRCRQDRTSAMAPASIDQVDGERRPDTDDANGATLGELVGTDGHNEPVNAQSPRLDVRGRNTPRTALRRHELRLRPMRMSSGLREGPVHTRTGHTGDDDPTNASAPAAGPSRATRARTPRTAVARPRAKHFPREVLTLPASKRLSVLRPNPPAPKHRPLDPRVPNIDKQYTARARRARRCSAGPAATPSAPRRTTRARAMSAPIRPQVVALTDTSPEINFFNPCGVSTSNAP